MIGHINILEKWRFSYLRQKRHLLWPSIASLAVMSLNFIFLKLYPNPQDQFLPLHYNIYFGIDYLGAYAELYFAPLFGLAVNVINLPLMYFFSKRIPVISGALSYSALLVQIAIALFLLITILKF